MAEEFHISASASHNSLVMEPEHADLSDAKKDAMRGGMRNATNGELLDLTDKKIVAALRRDGRLSVSALAEKLGVSRANTYTRLNKLLEVGVITGFAARVDHEKLGHATSAYVMIQLQQDAWQSVKRKVSHIPEVQHVALLGGDFDVILLVRAQDTADLRRVILHELQSIPGVRQTKTSLIFEDHDMDGI